MQTPRQMRGIQIELTSRDTKDRVYADDKLLGKYIEMLDEIPAGMLRSAGRPSAANSNCFGSGIFLNAMRAGGHFLTASQCVMADGWAGLSVSTGRAQFRFTGLDTAPFADAIARAREELKRR